MSLELFNEKATEMANSIRAKLGKTKKMPFKDFPFHINTIQTSEIEGLILDPVEFYTNNRPSDWSVIPEPDTDEIYLLCHIPETDTENNISFNVTLQTSTNNYSVDIGYIDPSSGDFVCDTNFSLKSNTQFNRNLIIDLNHYGPTVPMTSTNKYQIVILISGTQITRFNPEVNYDISKNFNYDVVEIACKIPSIKNIYLGRALLKSLRELVYFRMYGETPNLESYQNMFAYCWKLKAVIGVTGGEQVTTTDNMFKGCHALQAIPLMELPNCLSATMMFDECSSIKRVPEFTLPSCIDSTAMFNNCDSLIYMHDLQTDDNHYLSGMFSGCNKLKEVERVRFFVEEFAEVEIYDLFKNCYNLIALPPISNTAYITNLNGVFENCLSLESIEGLTITNKCESMFRTFKNCKHLTSTPYLDVISVVDFDETFSGCHMLSDLQINYTLHGENFNETFMDCVNLTDLSHLNMNGAKGGCVRTFYNCKSLVSLPELDVSLSNQFTSILQGCEALENIEKIIINGVYQTVSNGTYINGGNITYMFRDCSALSSVIVTTTAQNWQGIAISFINCNLGYHALLALFNNLPTITSQQRLSLKGNPGLNSLTEADKKIATDKNWKIDTSSTY